MAARDEVKVKGQSFHSVTRALGELRGDEFRAEVLERFAGEGGKRMREGSLLPATFYPVAWYRELFRAACELAPEVHDLAREAGRVSGERDLSGIYKVVIRAFSTAMVIKQSPRLFSLIYQGGAIEVIDVRDRYARLRYYDCFGFDRNVWQDAVGGAGAVFRATGADRLVLRVLEGGQDGDSTMVLSTSWM